MHSRTKNKLMLIFILCLFVSPFIISWWVLQTKDDSADRNTTNYGEFISPARPLPALSLVNTSEPDKVRDLQGKWTLVHFVGDECTEECKNLLFSLNQIEAAMGKNSLRVQRAVIALQPDTVNTVLSKYPDLWRIQLDGKDKTSFIDQFKYNEVVDPTTADYIYIVDPLGNLMMRYAPGFDPYGVLRDLRKLLKGSQIG